MQLDVACLRHTEYRIVQNRVCLHPVPMTHRHRLPNETWDHRLLDMEGMQILTVDSQVDQVQSTEAPEMAPQDLREGI